MRRVALEAILRDKNKNDISIQDYLYSAFYDTIAVKKLHRKLSF